MRLKFLTGLRSYSRCWEEPSFIEYAADLHFADSVSKELITLGSGNSRIVGNFTQKAMGDI